MRDSILFYINGKKHTVSGEAAFAPLTDYLRYEICLTGTKVVCAEGDCGACTILIGKPDAADKTFTYKAVNGCIQYVYQLDCTHIVTVEGIKFGENLNPLQESMMTCHGAQCGYCTPGIVTALSGHFFNKAAAQDQTPATEKDVRDALTGNLCRCTGYEAILKAGCQVKPADFKPLPQLYSEADMLAEFAALKTDTLQLAFEDRLYYAPTSIQEAVKIKSQHDNVTPLSGGTDTHVICNKRFIEPPILMSLARLDNFAAITETPTEIRVGGGTTLWDLEQFIAPHYPEFAKILYVFGSPQIKQAGTLAGNIGNGSPIADTLPFLYVTNARIELTGKNGAREIDINHFYTGYKKTVMTSDEFITAVLIPKAKQEDILKLYKISKREHLDISTFTAAIKLQLSGDAIQHVQLAYGGVGPNVLRLPQTEAFLTGKPATEKTFAQAGKIAIKEITPLSDVRGSQAYRLQLAENILFKFFHEAIASGVTA